MPGSRALKSVRLGGAAANLAHFGAGWRAGIAANVGRENPPSLESLPRSAGEGLRTKIDQKVMASCDW
jgi:hypothetical protein